MGGGAGREGRKGGGVRVGGERHRAAAFLPGAALPRPGRVASKRLAGRPVGPGWLLRDPWITHLKNSAHGTLPSAGRLFSSLE